MMMMQPRKLLQLLIVLVQSKIQRTWLSDNLQLVILDEVRAGQEVSVQLLTVSPWVLSLFVLSCASWPWTQH